MRVALAIAFFFLSLLVRAQDYTWKNYTIRDGLPHGNVYRIFQDRKGFLWFSTDYGMCSFDGRTFRSEFKDSNNYLNSSVLSISETEDGNKIACTITELLRITDSTITAHPWAAANRNAAYYYAKERAGSIWAIADSPKTSNARLLQLTASEVKYHDIRNAKGEPIEFNTMVVCPDELLFSSEDGLYAVRNNKIDRLYPNVIKGDVIDVARDKRGQYWVGLKEKVIVVKEGIVTLEMVMPDGQNVNDVFLDRNDDLWITTEEGGLLKMKQGKVQKIPGLRSMGPIIINDIFQDFEGNIWLATYGSGVFMLHSMDIINYTSGENVNSIFTRVLSIVNDKIWISTIGKVFTLDDGHITPVPVHTLKSENYTYFLKQVGQRLIIGTPFETIIKDLTPPYKEKMLLPASISACKDSKERVWLGGFKGLALLVNDSIVRHPVSDFIGERRVNKIFEDSKGNIWCATGDGVVVFDPEGKRPPRRLLEKLQIVQDVTEDNMHRMWLATTNGVACIEENNHKILTKANGLASTSAISLLVADNVLWVGTSRGLNMIDLKTLQVKSITPIIFKDVIISLCRKDDDLYVGTANSMYSIPLKPEKDDVPPPVFITGVRTHGKEINWPARLELPYKENGVQINFIGISYQASHLVEYRYRITNLDDQWRYTTNSQIEIPSLPSGNYTFVLNARKNNGAWTKDVTLDIVVATPFWRTWWFMGMAVIVVGIGLFVFTRRYTIKAEASKRKQLMVYNKMAYLKQQALAALINPHFIFNCMNSIQHFLHSNDKEAANEYMADFAQLIRMTLEDAQASFLSLDKEVSRIRLYLSLEQLRYENKLQYAIEIDPAIDVHNARIPNMILQPYVENAIWHGIVPKETQGMIHVRFMLQGEDRLKIVVEDDGLGIAEDPLQHTSDSRPSYGIKLTTERLQLLRELSAQYYDISIQRLNNADDSITGTRVEIIVPTRPNEEFLKKIEGDIS